MTPDDLKKLNVYADLCGKYVKQMILVTAFYEERGQKPRDDGLEALRNAVRSHRLPRHMWPLPEGIDSCIEDLGRMTEIFDDITARMESESREL